MADQETLEKRLKLAEVDLEMAIKLLTDTLEIVKGTHELLNNQDR